MPFWAYILRCADDSFYTGHTDNWRRGSAPTRSASVAPHTRRRRPVTLAWCQEFPSRLEALEAERQIKGWSRAKKQALIGGDWARLSLLARNRQSPSTSSGRTDVEGQALPVRAGPLDERRNL
jgi:putative endonuclease